MDLRIYPNPTKELVNVIFHQQNTSNVNISVTDITGRLLLNKNITAINRTNSVPISVKSLPAGSYFIKLNGNENESSS